MEWKMASTGESSVSETSSNIENSEYTVIKCGQCKRPMKEKIMCKKCKTSFNPGCLITANKSKSNTCHHEPEEKKELLEKVILENEMLKRIICELEEKYKLLEENKCLLLENNKLLRESNEYLQEKIQQKEGTADSTANKIWPKKYETTSQQKRSKKQIQEVQQKQMSNKTQEGQDIIEIVQQEGTSEEIRTTTEKRQTSVKEGNERGQSQNDLRTSRVSNRKPLFYGTSTEGPAKALPRRLWFFVSRMNPEMKDSDLLQILKQKSPKADSWWKKESYIINIKAHLKSEFQLN